MVVVVWDVVVERVDVEGVGLEEALVLGELRRGSVCWRSWIAWLGLVCRRGSATAKNSWSVWVAGDDVDGVVGCDVGDRRGGGSLVGGVAVG